MPEGQLQPLPGGNSSTKFKGTEEHPQGVRGLPHKLASSASNVWLAMTQILGPRLRMTTLTLVFTWMVAAFVYYGLVTLLTHVDFVKGASKQCIDGKLVLPHADLVGILITSSAEVPGLLFSLVMVAYLGRKLAFAVPMAALAVVLIPLLAGATGPVVGGVQVGVVVCMYLARFFIYSSFNILWAMSPEYYPTSIRNFGLGVSNAFSRIGGLLSPFASVNARQDAAWHHAPEAIFAALSLVAGAIVLVLPPDKKGKALDDCVEEVEQVPEMQCKVSSVIHAPRMCMCMCMMVVHAQRCLTGSQLWCS
ncbi:major facilitator superfamily domain-containing protein [Scenedesmus sp. NREL 46B-D3]|nr:major facilitator superfamily domain-containing protein [Scenedesmus sp. NREL 46B-D3]